MKAFKKFGALLVAALLVVAALAPAALATPATPAGGTANKAGTAHTITVDASTADTTVTPAGPLSGHDFNAYQIFYGDTSNATSNQMSVVGWGDGINGQAVIDAFTTGSYTSKGGETIEISQALKDRFAGAASAADFAMKMAAKAESAAGANDGWDALNAEQTAELAKIFRANINDAAKVPLEEGTGADAGKYSALVNDGYWLVVDDTNVTDSENDFASANIMVVVDDVNQTVKGSIPKSDKSVSKGQTTTSGYNSFPAPTSMQDKTDANIGDTLHYTLVGTTSDQLPKFDTYYYEFNDSLSKGLTFDASTVKVFHGTTDITEYFKVYKAYDPKATPPVAEEFGATEKVSGDPLSIRIICEDLKQVPGMVGGDVLTVAYDAVLNSDAIIGDIGNQNDMKVIYSNNPDTDDKGESTPSKTTVMTLRLDISKIDSEANPLPGAEFKLFRLSTEGLLEYLKASGPVDEDVYEEATVEATDNPKDKGLYEYDAATDAYTLTNDETPAAGKTYYEFHKLAVYTVQGWTTGVANSGTNAAPKSDSIPADATTLTSGTDGDPDSYREIAIKGLEGGEAGKKYYLTETKAPAGYNKLANNIEYEVKSTTTDTATTTYVPVAAPVDDDIASYYEKQGDNYVLTQDARVQTGKTYYECVIDYGLSDFSVTNSTADPATGIADTKVENSNDLVLPVTGGIGTTIFYTVGALLVVGAGVLLVTRRRVAVK